MTIYKIYNVDGKLITTGQNFGDAKNIHKANLPQELVDAYAGIDTSRMHKYSENYKNVVDCYPCFYAESMTDDLRAKYGYGE